MRLDLFLVQSKKALSRTQAQDLIENKYIFLKTSEKTTLLTKPSFEVSESIEKFIFVSENPLQKYVSRAGLKLDSALQKLQLNVENKIVLDVGQSTGGFTDCLLSHKAQKVVGLDVGHDQLHSSLKNNPRIISIENLNAKEIDQSVLFKAAKPVQGFDLIVMDVSFISITKVMSFLQPHLSMTGEYLFLVKPQFEAGPNALDKNGVVTDEKVYTLVENQVKEAALHIFKDVQNYFKSDLPGKDGNQEFFIYGKNKS